MVIYKIKTALFSLKMQSTNYSHNNDKVSLQQSKIFFGTVYRCLLI